MGLWVPFGGALGTKLGMLGSVLGVVGCLLGLYLDIAGVTWLSNSTKTSSAGASGWGVKLLFDLTIFFIDF